VSINGRIQRLQARIAGACPECHHKPEAIHVYYPDIGQEAPEVPACSSCGRSLGVVFKVVYDGEEGEGATVGREMRRY
jgi:hypothetical protein